VRERDDDGNVIPEFFGIRAAGRRVNRSRYTIHRWLQQGMPYKVVDERRYIELTDLHLWLRKKIKARRQSLWKEGQKHQRRRQP
jgi:hypothetical protein